MQQSIIYRQILEEGELKGKAEEKQRTALSLLQEGLSLDLIAEVTELPLTQIQSLQKQLNYESIN
jgi:predicted transposase YdaD